VYSEAQQAVLEVGASGDLGRGESGYGDTADGSGGGVAVAVGGEDDGSRCVDDGDECELGIEAEFGDSLGVAGVRGWRRQRRPNSNTEDVENGEGLCLITLEGINVGSIDSEFAKSGKLRLGDLLKFQVLSLFEPCPMCIIDLFFKVGAAREVVVGDKTQFVLEDPVFMQRCSPSRALADSWYAMRL